MFFDSPDYTRVCGHCVKPIEGRSTQINGIAFHPDCLGEMYEEMEAEYQEREKSEGITSYELSADDADYRGWIQR